MAFQGKGLEQGQKSSLENDNSIEGVSKVKVTGSVLPPSEITHSGETPVITDSAGDEIGGEGQTKPIPPVHFYALESEQRILELVRPLYVVVYDPEMAFVRELEVFKAMNQDRQLKVYFLLYEDSTEVRRFETTIKKENTAFENLIRQKATMTIPVDQVCSRLNRCVLLFAYCYPCVHVFRAGFIDLLLILCISAIRFSFPVANVQFLQLYHYSLTYVLSIQDGRMLDASPTKTSATGVQLNASTRKGGGLRKAQKQMQVCCSGNISDVEC